jgi:hypothetical protein
MDSFRDIKDGEPGRTPILRCVALGGVSESAYLLIGRKHTVKWPAPHFTVFLLYDYILVFERICIDEDNYLTLTYFPLNSDFMMSAIINSNPHRHHFIKG